MRLYSLLVILVSLSASAQTVTTARMTKWTWNGCGDPTPTSRFSTADPQAHLYWEATGVSSSDVFTNQWYRPNGTVYDSGKWQSGSGSRCFGTLIDIAGHEPATTTGTWTVTVFKNGNYLFQASFVISPDSGTPTAAGPHIDKIDPMVASPGVDTTFTITGSGFKSGFSGRLRINNDPNQWPIWPGSQTIWESDSRVKLVVKVGGPNDPPVNFSLQTINPSPGNEPSNEFGGLRTSGATTPPPPSGGSRWQYDSDQLYPTVILEKSALGGGKYTYRATVIGRSTVLAPGIWRCQLTMIYPDGVHSDRSGIQIATTAADRATILSGVAGWSVIPRATESSKGAAGAKVISDLFGLYDPIALIQTGSDMTDFLAAGDYGPSSWFSNKIESDDYHVVPLSYVAQKNFLTGGTGVMAVRFVLPSVDEASGNSPEFYVLAETPGFDVYSFEIGTDRQAVVRHR